MNTKKYLNICLISMSLSMLFLCLPACSVVSFVEPLRKSVVGINKSSHKISVISVTGIQAFQKGHGPQNISWGNLSPTGYASIESRGHLYLEYPVEIKWVNGFVRNFEAEYPSALVQKVTKIYGVEAGKNEFSEEMSLILVFNGAEWAGYYAPKVSLLEKDINKIIDSY